MRQWIDLFENRVKDAQRIDTSTFTAAPDSIGDLSVSKPTEVVPGQPAAQSSTRAAINTPLDAQSHAHLSDLVASGLTDEIDDAEAARRAGFSGEFTTTSATPEPVPVENLPAVIRNDMMAHGDPQFDPQSFNPEWHQVKHLPGYMQSAIRAMGRAVFAPFTDTPIEDIQVLSTLSNPTDDVKKMMKWVSINGIRDDEAELKFEQIMPGYSAQTKIYNTDDFTFMLVSDHMGKYIYGWSGGRAFQLDAPQQMARLEGMNDDARRNLRELAQQAKPLETAYRKFMETPMIDDEDETPQPTGQSNSTTKPVAPGQQSNAPEPEETAAPAPDRSVLSPAQQAAKEKADLQHQKINNGMQK